MTYDVDLDTKLIRNIIKVHPYTNYLVCTPNGSARIVPTTRQTDRINFIPWTTEAGGKMRLPH